MTIFIAADHRGFELKNKLIDYLHEKNIRIEDLGNYQLDPEDDYPDFAKKVAQAVLQNPQNYLGILICGSGVGVDIVANRNKGIRCGVAVNLEQIKRAREHDHINILSLASDEFAFEQATDLVNAFLETQPSSVEKYLRRIKKIEETEV